MKKRTAVAAISLSLALTLLGQAPPPASKKQPAGARPPAAAKTPASKPPAGPPTAPLLEIHVKGNRYYKTEDIVAASGLSIGQRVATVDFEPARERLLASGGFQTISYRYAPTATNDGYSLTFEVSEIERTLPVRFEELPIPDAELIKYLKQKEPLFGGDRAPGNQPVLERLAKTLNDRMPGLPAPVTAMVLAGDQPNDLFVLFRPNTRRPRVAQIAFTGNKVLDTPTIANAFAIVSIGVEYKEATVRQLLDSSVKPLYEARGYLGIQFPKITAKPTKDVDGLDVVIQVAEGMPYKYGEINAVGPGIPAKEVYSIANIKPGETANFDTVNEIPKKLVDRMELDGYMRAKASYDRKIDNKNFTVNITFRTEPGAQYTFNKLSIEGLDLIGEPAIRKMWGLKYGKPYNTDYPKKFLNEVKEQGLFDGLKETKFETALDDAAKTVDVKLFFRGGGSK